MGAGRFSVDTIFGAKDHMSGPMASMAMKATAFEKSLGGANKVADKISGGLMSVAAWGTAAAVGVGGIAGSVIAVGMDFEKTMSGVAAVSGATDQQFDQLKSRALELGVAGKFNATEVAGAFEIMAKAGLNVNQILAGTPGLLSAAAADGAGIEETAGSIMGAMKAMGIAPEKMQLFADQMAKAGDSTDASIGSISQSLAIAGPVFKQLNVPMSSAIAQIALLQDAGVDASSTGTQLASTYSKLAAPMGETKKAIASLGLKITDAYGNMKPPEELFDEILGATSKIKGNAGKMAAFTHLVGLESQKALLNVASAASDGRLSALTIGLNNAAGYADALSKKRLNNLAGDLTILRANVETFATKLFDLEKGPLRDVVKGTTAWVQANSDVMLSGIGDKITEWTPLVKNFGDGMKDAFTEAKPVIEGVAGALSGVFGSGAGGARIQAYELGNNIATAAVRLGEFWLITKAVTAATATWSFVVGAAKKAQMAWTVATLAFETSIKTARATTLALAIAADAGVVSGNAWSLSMIRMRLASLSAAGGMKALAVASGAALVAIAAVMAAKDQNDQLEKETGGKGILDVGWEWATTDKGLKEIADENLDKQAKQRRIEADKKEAERYETGTSAFDVRELGGLGAAGSFDALAKQLETLDKASGQLPPTAGPMVALGAGGAAPVNGMPVTLPSGSKDPPVVSLREDSTAKLSQDMGAAVKGALKGVITITIKDPGKNASVETDGSDVMSIDPSGSF